MKKYRYNKKNHVLDFITDSYKFVDKWGITSSLDIDENMQVDDLSTDMCNEPAGIIAEIQNINGEYTGRLLEFYTRTGDKKNLAKLNRIINKYQR